VEPERNLELRKIWRAPASAQVEKVCRGMWRARGVEGGGTAANSISESRRNSVLFAVSGSPPRPRAGRETSAPAARRVAARVVWRAQAHVAVLARASPPARNAVQRWVVRSKAAKCHVQAANARVA